MLPPLATSTTSRFDPHASPIVYVPPAQPSETFRAEESVRTEESSRAGESIRTDTAHNMPMPMAPKPQRADSLDAIVAKHTATKLNSSLTRAYLTQSIRTGLPLLVIDLLVSTCSLVIAFYLVNLSLGRGFDIAFLRQLPALLLIQVGLMAMHQLYPGVGISPVSELRSIVRSTLLACVCLSALNIIFGQLPRAELAVFACTALFASILLTFARHYARRVLAGTKWWGIRTLLVGSRSDCDRVLEKLKHRRSAGLSVVGYVSVSERCERRGPSVGIRHAEDAFHVASSRQAPIAALATSANHLQISRRILFLFPAVVWVNHDVTSEQPCDLLASCSTRFRMPISRVAPRFCKRALDLAICIPGLVLLALPMAAIALAIKVMSPGSVLYGSTRMGRHGKTFKMWKFRSMVPDADQVLQRRLQSDPAARREWEGDSKLKSDPRIIPGIGHLLRRWSLDELPQLWNVLVGEMSLVGPRPVLPSEIVRYQDNYYQYTQMCPGLTGLWQVSGRNDTTFDTRIFLVRQYAANWSIWLDAWILFKTPFAVLNQRGAY